MVLYVGGWLVVFFGLPPSLPFWREVAAFFSEVFMPPSLPSACACGFFILHKSGGGDDGFFFGCHETKKKIRLLHIEETEYSPRNNPPDCPESSE